MLLAHCAGTDYIKPILGCVAREQVLILVGDKIGMAIATREIAAPEFISL